MINQSDFIRHEENNLSRLILLFSLNDVTSTMKYEGRDGSFKNIFCGLFVALRPQQQDIQRG